MSLHAVGQTRFTSGCFLENFSHLAESPNGVQRIRGLILDLAVRGELCPGSQIDEPIHELLRRIHEKRASSVGLGGKGNQSEPFPIDEGEIPFLLPESWQWVRLEDVSEYIQRGKSPKYTERSDDVPVVSQKCVQWEGFQIEKARFVEPETLASYGHERFLRNGDLLWNSTGTGTVGRIAIYTDKDHDFPKVVADSHVAVVRLLEILPRFVWCWIASPTVQCTIDDISSGTTNQKELNTSTVKRHLLPLPPVKEQERIVNQLDCLMALCDELEERQTRKRKLIVQVNQSSLHRLTTAKDSKRFEKHWKKVSDHFDTLYEVPENVAELRQAILQLAVQGKLVRQNSRDEPASQLLGRIREEQKKLVAAGKIKKPKALPPLDQAKTPFSLPEGWTWARFPELGEFGRGKSKHRPRNAPKLYVGGTIPFVQTGDVARANGVIETYTSKYNDVVLEQSRLWKTGTLCITIAANIGDVALTTYPVACPDSLVAIIPTAAADTLWLLYLLAARKDRLDRNAPESAQKNINLQTLRPLLVAVPPRAEQEAIRAAIVSVADVGRASAAELATLRRAKSGLLQDLLTGKVRVSV